MTAPSVLTPLARHHAALSELSAALSEEEAAHARTVTALRRAEETATALRFAPASEAEERLLRPEEAAKRLAVGRSTVYAMIQRGEMPSRRFTPGIVRIPERQLNEWLSVRQTPEEQAEIMGGPPVRVVKGGRPSR